MSKRNYFYNAEIYKQVNKESLRILGDYILELKSKKKSDKTIYQYAADIKMFLCWAYNELDNKSLLDMKKREFRRFFIVLQDSGSSSARINRVQCSLRNLLEFCTEDEDEYDYDINSMKSIKGLQKEEVREIIFLSDEEINIILDDLLERGKYQQALYVSLSYDSAGRRNEVYQVLKKDFLTNSKTNEVKGKGKKRFKLMYFSRTREIAAKYFDQRGEDNIESLWVTGRGDNKRQVKYETLYNWCLSFRKILEVKTGRQSLLNPHSFRHSALENYSDGTHSTLRELGKDKLELKVLKVLANHESIDTTSSYLKNKDQELLDEAFGL